MKSFMAALTRELAILLRAWGDTQSDQFFVSTLPQRHQQPATRVQPWLRRA
jgi:hypothetical protein